MQIISKGAAFSNNLWRKTPASSVLFLFFISIYSFTMSGTIQYGDEVEKYRVAQSIVERQDFAIRPTVMYHKVGVDQRIYSTYELGQSILEVPFYALGKTIYSFLPASDINWIGQLFVGMLNPILTALTCVLLFKLGQSLGFQYRTSLILALLFGLSTIAWHYSKGFTREPLLGFLILLTFYILYLYEKTQQARWLFAAGIVAGYLVFSKFLQSSVLPFFAIYIAVSIFYARRRTGETFKQSMPPVIKGLVLFALPIVLFLALQSLYALLRFGTILLGIAGTRSVVTTDVPALLSASNPALMSVRILFSPEKSIFLYSPPILLFLIAWFKWLRKRAPESLLILGLILGAVAVSLTRPDGDGGTWWGTRYLVQITPLAILPIGVLLESSNRAAQKFWGFVLAILFAIGLLVQLVGALSNDRDYLDITGSGISLFGQLDFLRYGALDSLLLYLSPAGFPVGINPYGVLLIVFGAISGGWIVMQLRQKSEPAVPVRWYGLALLVVVLGIQFAAFVKWVVAPYPQALVAKANTEFVAGNLFLADGKKCQARAMYLLALERGTAYQAETLARLRELMPRANGMEISTQDLLKNLEMPDNALATTDTTRTLFGEGSLQVAVPSPNDAIARVVSDPMPVLPNGIYELSGWIRTENVYGAGYGVVTVHEDDGKYSNARGTDIVAVDETTGWRPFQQSITMLPTTRRIFIAAGLWKTQGMLWVDGLQLAKISKETPVSGGILCR